MTTFSTVTRPVLKYYLIDCKPVYITHLSGLTDTREVLSSLDTIAAYTKTALTPLITLNHSRNHIEFTNGLTIPLKSFNHDTIYYHIDNFICIVDRFPHEDEEVGYTYDVTIFKLKGSECND